MSGWWVGECYREKVEYLVLEYFDVVYGDILWKYIRCEDDVVKYEFFGF